MALPPVNLKFAYNVGWATNAVWLNTTISSSSFDTASGTNVSLGSVLVSYTDAANFDFHPVTASPTEILTGGLDGTDSFGFSTDLYGNDRPVGQWARGAAQGAPTN